MSADLLREAAALMRSRAESVERDDPASRDGWYAHLGPAGTSWINDRHGHLLSTHGFPRHAEHIASWHPAVALAVADLLDGLAKWLLPCEEPCWERGIEGCPDCEVYSPALVVARAYLGRES